MNLEEWLEKMKEKPDTVWCKSDAYPPNKCRYCNKGLYKRGVYKHSRFLIDINAYCCTTCKEERERAKQRDSFFGFDTDWPVSFLQEEEEAWLKFEREPLDIPKVVRKGDKCDFNKTITINEENIDKFYNKDESLEQRVREVLNLLRKEFKEVNITL